MKKKALIKGIVALSALALIGGGVVAANAANTTVSSDTSTATVKRESFGPRGGRGERGQKPTELTDAQKAEMETKLAERKTKQEAVKTALASGNYDTWVAAVKAADEKCPLLEKITVSNFSRYAEAENLRQQAESIMEELGLSGKGLGMGQGMGQDMGEPGRGHGPRPVARTATDTTTAAE